MRKKQKSLSQSSSFALQNVPHSFHCDSWAVNVGGTVWKRARAFAIVASTDNAPLHKAFTDLHRPQPAVSTLFHMLGDIRDQHASKYSLHLGWSSWMTCFLPSNSNIVKGTTSDSLWSQTWAKHFEDLLFFRVQDQRFSFSVLFVFTFHPFVIW